MREKKERMLEKADEIELVLVQQEHVTGAPGDITVSFIVSETESHLRARRIFIFSVCSTCCELSLVFDTCVYAVAMAAGGN